MGRKCGQCNIDGVCTSCSLQNISSEKKLMVFNYCMLPTVDASKIKKGTYIRLDAAPVDHTSHIVNWCCVIGCSRLT